MNTQEYKQFIVEHSIDDIECEYKWVLTSLYNTKSKQQGKQFRKLALQRDVLALVLLSHGR